MNQTDRFSHEIIAAMSNVIKKTISTTVRTETLQANYHRERDEFELIFDPHLQFEDGPLKEMRVILPADMVRQMADLLPPIDPETVH